VRFHTSDKIGRIDGIFTHDDRIDRRRRVFVVLTQLENHEQEQTHDLLVGRKTFAEGRTTIVGLSAIDPRPPLYVIYDNKTERHVLIDWLIHVV
jgi:hypothetical protein